MRQEVVDPLGFFDAGDAQHQVGTAHGLEMICGNVGTEELRPAQRRSRVEHHVLPLRPHVRRIRLLTMPHEKRDPATKMLLVEANLYRPLGGRIYGYVDRDAYPANPDRTPHPAPTP